MFSLIASHTEYSGTGSPQKYYDYVGSADKFASELGDINITPLAEMRLIASKLRGNAKMWWLNHKNTYPITHKKRIKTWDQLKDALLKHYIPPEYI